MQKINWKKMLLFGSIASVTPALQNWATATQSGQDIPFTVGNILLPAIPQAIAIFSALFTNPWRKQ